MEYIIEIEDSVNNILTHNANRNGMSVQALISELLKRYLIDAHIMEKSDLWKNGIEECAELNLEWANL